MHFKFIDKIKSRIADKKKTISYKYVHLIKDDKFTVPFVELMNTNFNPKEQCFIYMKPPSGTFDIPENYQNVIILKNSKDLKFNLKRVKKIFLHSIPPSRAQYLYEHKNLLNHCYWIVFGFDIYCEDNEYGSFVKNNVKAVVTNFDKTTYQNKYNKNTPIYPLPYYPSAVKKEFLDRVSPEKKNFITVQINNSSDESTLEMLEILSKFKNEKMKVATILSYGKMEYKDEILKKGKEIFKDNFIAITEHMQSEDYAKYLKSTDILVLNQNRQQGVQNIRCNFYIGNKVFIKKNITTFQGFSNQGFRVFDTGRIKDMNFDEFIAFSNEDRITNKNLVSNYFNNTDLISSWTYLYSKEA